MFKSRYAIGLAIISGLLSAVPAAAQRKPDAPPEKESVPPENVADDEFREAFRQLGYSRLAVFVHVHAADVQKESRQAETTIEDGSGDQEAGVHRSDGLKLRVVPKEEQTNAWRITRALAERLRECFRHREIRMSLVGLSDLNPDLATEVRAMVLRDEAGAARQIGKAVGADLVILLSLSRASAHDAGSAAYGANFFVADVKRDESLTSWSWDLKPDRDGAYPAPMLGRHARQAAQLIRDRLVSYARQAGEAGRPLLRYHTVRFFGVQSEQVGRLKETLAGIAGVHVLQAEFSSDEAASVATMEIESPSDPVELAEEIRRQAGDTLGVELTYKKVREGAMDFTVSNP